jgi:hypothetical protein
MDDRWKSILGLFSKAIQLGCDVFVLVVVLTVTITASVFLDTALPFVTTLYPVPLYFTLPTFYATYTNTVSFVS